jgi:type I restriction enzyme S subunit
MNGGNDLKTTGIEWIPEAPHTWRLIRSKYLFRNKSEKNHSDQPLLSVTQRSGVVVRSESETKVWNPSDDVSSYKLIEPGDFVISLRSFEGGLELSKVRGIVSPAYTVLEKRVALDDHYFWWLMKSHPFIVELNKNVSGIRQGKNIGWDDFANICLPNPPIDEQKLISRYLDKKTAQIDLLIEKIEKKIELLKEQRTSLINQYVTKGLDPNVEMKDSGVEWIGKIPKHWELKKIKHLSVVKRGSSPRPIDDPKYFSEDGEYSWVRISDVSASEKYLIETTEKLSTLGASLSTKRHPGDLFLSIAGTVGKPIITRINCCIHDGFVWFDNLSIDTDFLYYSFLTGTCFQGLGKMGTQLNLNTETVGDIFIPLSTPDEQRQIVAHIVAILERLDSVTANETRRLNLLSEYRQSLISSVVTGKVRLTEDMV